jgi:hypothetical protein
LGAACLVARFGEPIIAALISEENFKLTLLQAAKGTSSPVCKLRPSLGLQVFGEKVPKPLISKELPALTISLTTSKNCSTTTFAQSLVVPQDIAVSLIKSFFVIGIAKRI